LAKQVLSIGGELVVIGNTNIPLLAVLISIGLIFTGSGIQEAAGNTYSCQKIANDCESSNNIEYGSCLGFFAGVSGWEIFLQANLDKHKVFCFPETITTGKLKRIFLKYTAEHPEELSNGASLCFYYAMAEAFPCKKPAE
jgi:hypothetical protein